MTYNMGDFSFIDDKMSKTMVEDAYNAVSKTEGGWEFLKTYEPESGKGFMFSSHEMLGRISSNMKMHDMHSGSSYAWTMRQVEYIAKKGWSSFVQTWITVSLLD